ncbi:MAG TPA: hypothetical protein VH255_03605 [Verrucomicrobiae bacterium]|jgi:hypothetical protein|nr:hypothetical protein [Verrucomicrobiae bacterium]
MRLIEFAGNGAHMIPIKIQCGCGQRYAFDVETATGAMPYPVACPICGTDGTPAANLAISQSVSASQPVPGIHLSPQDQVVPPPISPRRSVSNIPPVDPTQIGHEAKAKIFWGDTQEEVIKFMMMNGFSAHEATGVVQTMFRERTAAIRKNGMGKMMISVPLMCVPVVGFFVFKSIGYFPIKLFGMLILVGLWGVWMLLKGTIMFVSPKSEPGDVADK